MKNNQVFVELLLFGICFIAAVKSFEFIIKNGFSRWFVPVVIVLCNAIGVAVFLVIKIMLDVLS